MVELGGGRGPLLSRKDGGLLRRAVQAFSRFADLEDEIEPVEAEVEKIAEDLDRELNLRIDMARGK